jgi:multicomponent Na+:H+ antiporter subunit C
MPLSYALLVGLLFAVGVYLLLRGSIVDLVFGLLVLTHAANLLVFAGGGLLRGASPIGVEVAMADPLPQALVLTAIVIGLGVAAFAVVLVARLYDVSCTEELPSRDDDARDADVEEERE